MRALRTIGLLTAGYGAFSIARPQALGKMLHQTDSLGEAQPGAVVASYAVGVRDLVSGASLVLLPAGRARAAAVVTRLAFDVADGLLWPAALPEARTRRAVRGVAWGWAGVTALAYAKGAAGDLVHRRRDS